MKKRTSFITFLLCFLFINLLAQKPNSQDSVDISFIKTLPNSSLIWELEEVGDSTYNAIWLPNSFLRHEVIKRLDQIFDWKYDMWFEPKVFMATTSVDTNDVVIGIIKESIGHKQYYSITADYKRREWRLIRDKLFFNRWDILFTYLQFDVEVYDQAIIEANLSNIENHKTLQYLSNEYNRRIDNKEYNYVSESIKARNFDLIRERLAIVESEEFVHYRSYVASPKAVKAIDLYMDNDLLTLGDLNQDREYSGGSALTLSTDYFAARWLNIGWLRNLKKGSLNKPRPMVITYQSITLGMHFFTPYIRYRNNYELADTLFQHDRPFGSYIYLERSKYSLWPKGLVRHHGTFQVGVIGSYAGRDIQAMLHRDASVESQKVYGWSKQIANGGRWLIQLNQEADILLFSTTNDYGSIFCTKCRKAKNSPFFEYFGLNVIGTGEVLFGGFLTAAGGGLKLSTSDFTKQSGQKTIKPFKNNIYNFGVYLDLGIRYRYIIHNSMLEGFGYLTTYLDDQYDDDAQSVYTLNQDYYNSDGSAKNSVRYNRTPKEYDQLNRHLFLFDFSLNLRLRRMTVYWQMTYSTKEYTVEPVDYESLTYLVKDADKEFYETTSIPENEEFNEKKFYGFGTIGVTWLLGDW